MESHVLSLGQTGPKVGVGWGGGDLGGEEIVIWGWEELIGVGGAIGMGVGFWGVKMWHLGKWWCWWEDAGGRMLG